MIDSAGMVKVGLQAPDGEFETMWATPMGADRYRYEGYNPRYFSIDTPPGVALGAVIEYLTRNEHQWEHVDPTDDELCGDSPSTSTDHAG